MTYSGPTDWPWTPTGRGLTPAASMVRAGGERMASRVSSPRGWNSLVTGGITAYQLAGDHYTIMQRPAVERLAGILSVEIERLGNHRGRGRSSMNLVRLLLRSSPGVVILSATRRGDRSMAGSHRRADPERAARERSTPAPRWAFARALPRVGCGAVIGQVGMVKLGQRTVAELGLHIVRRTLELPCAIRVDRHLALLAALTEDIVLIANAMVGVPSPLHQHPDRDRLPGLHRLALASDLRVRGDLRRSGDRRLRGPVSRASRNSDARDRQDALVGHFRTLIGGFRELKLHRGRRACVPRRSVEPTMASSPRHGPRPQRLRGRRGWSQIAFFGFIGVLLFAVPRLEPIGLPTLVSAVLVVLYLMTPLDIDPHLAADRGPARASLLKVQSLIPALERHGDAAEGRPAPARPLALHDSVSLEAATFAYRDGHDDAGFVLGPVNLTLRRGEIVILAGGNGCGKTTLVKLISGLYSPEAGILRLDGRVARGRGSRGLSTARLGRLRRRPSLPRPPWARPGWDRGEGPRGAGRPGAGGRGLGPGELVLDHRPLPGAAAPAGLARRLPRGTADLHTRRVGRQSGLLVQAVLLFQAAPQAEGRGQGAPGDQPR